MASGTVAAESDSEPLQGDFFEANDRLRAGEVFGDPQAGALEDARDIECGGLLGRERRAERDHSQRGREAGVHARIISACAKNGFGETGSAGYLTVKSKLTGTLVGA